MMRVVFIPLFFNMNWKGKVIGGSLGSFFGPVGTVVGATVGHWMVDRKQTALTRKEAQRTMVLTAAVLYGIARADTGRTRDEEDAVIQEILTALNNQLNAALDARTRLLLRQDTRQIDNPIERLNAHTTLPHEQRQTLLHCLWRVAVSDGEETREEVAYIRAFIEYMRIPYDQAQTIGRHYSRKIDTDAGPAAARARACKTLSIDLYADEEIIKRAFRTLSMRYHPDRLTQATPEQKAAATQRFAEVKEAYDLLSSTPDAIETLFVLDAHSDSIGAVQPRQVIRCFACKQTIRLPSTHTQIYTSRCPTCQTLLAFNETAQRLRPIWKTN
jgi:DnaJ like chaperone protein